MDAPTENDPALALYLRAQSEDQAAVQLVSLFRLQAEPVIEQILRAKRSATIHGELEVEDVTSAAREQLMRQLALLRDGEREPIRDLRGYVASITYSAWAEMLRARYPQRAMLFNRLRYLLEDRTTQKGFAIWPDEDGAKWCGLAPWRGRTGGATPKRHWLLLDPRAAAAEALNGADPTTLILPELLARLLHWLGGPIELRDLTSLLSELLGYAKGSVSPSEEEVVQIDPRASPAEELVWKEYLAWLWREMDSLSIRQRRSFLLHFEIVRELELLGIASTRAIAGALDFSPNEFAVLWNHLPLEDLAISKLLDCTRQQVINLRRVSRDKLGAAWQKWNVSNKRAEFASISLKA